MKITVLNLRNYLKTVFSLKSLKGFVYYDVKGKGRMSGGHDPRDTNVGIKSYRSPFLFLKDIL